jgi:hypothetical protein
LKHSANGNRPRRSRKRADGLVELKRRRTNDFRTLGARFTIHDRIEILRDLLIFDIRGLNEAGRSDRSPTFTG